MTRSAEAIVSGRCAMMIRVSYPMSEMDPIRPRVKWAAGCFVFTEPRRTSGEAEAGEAHPGGGHARILDGAPHRLARDVLSIGRATIGL